MEPGLNMRALHVPEFNRHNSRGAASMCRLVIRTPCSDDKSEVPTLVLNLGVVTHREMGDSGRRCGKRGVW